MSTLTLTTPSAHPTPAEITALTVPEEPKRAIKSWRRLVTGIDPAARPGARQLQGPWLTPRRAYALPLGAVVLTCDRFSHEWRVTMAIVETGELTVVKEWRLKSPMGARVVAYVGRRLPKNAATHQAVMLEDEPNRYAGRCIHCRQKVLATTGRLVDYGDRKRVAHARNECPPPPPPPAVITPNRHSGLCYLCGHWVNAGEGVALRLAERDSVTGSWYRPAHQIEPGACPPDALPGPVNRAAAWCADCEQLVSPGEGYWFPLGEDRLHHREACPTPTLTGPSWIVRRPRHEAPYEVGQVRRVRVDLRRGGDPVPEDVPGRRVLSETYIEFVALVAETVQRGRRQLARVCPATGTEAVDDLARDAAAAVEARPDAGAHTAPWFAEKIGDTAPWLAEITGRDPDFVYSREFIRPQRDYRRSNSRGTRGVVFHWVLEPNRVYEALEPISHRRQERVFLRATPEGDTVEITREEVEAWLNHGPAWPAS